MLLGDMMKVRSAPRLRLTITYITSIPTSVPASANRKRRTDLVLLGIPMLPDILLPTRVPIQHHMVELHSQRFLDARLDGEQEGRVGVV